MIIKDIAKQGIPEIGNILPLKKINIIPIKINKKIEIVVVPNLGEPNSHQDNVGIILEEKKIQKLIEKMWMNGADGYGRLKLLPTPMGQICITLLGNGVKLGVSSRGSGNVTESGNVSEFEIQTVDIVANPSAPDAYPDPIYEAIMNGPRGNILMDVANATNHDTKAQKYLQEEVLRLINNLGIRR